MYVRMSGRKENYERVLAVICSTGDLDCGTWLSGLGCGWCPMKGRLRAVSASNEKSRDCILEKGLKHEVILDRG